MSSVKITTSPRGGDVPDVIADEMIGMVINCCTPNAVYGLGCVPSQDKVKRHVNGVFAVSVFKIIEAAKYPYNQQYQSVLEWFRDQFPYAESGYDNSYFIVTEKHCEYRP